MVKRLFVDTPGTIIRVREGALALAYEGKLLRIRFEDLEEIRIGPGVLISTDVLLKAIETKTTVFLTNSQGYLEGILMPATYTGTIKTQREQIRAYDDERGTTLMKSFAKASILTRAKLLKQLAENRRDKPEAQILRDVAEKINEIAERIEEIEGHIDAIRTNIMSLEANAAEKYFKALKLVIPEKYGYKGIRTRRPPKDPFNAAISFANNRVRELTLQAVIAAGLHPYFGFLHADKPGRFSLALDLAEEFIVPIAHAVVIKLFTKEMIKEKDYQQRGKGVYLTRIGREKVLLELEKRLEKKIRFKGINTTIRNAIYHQARHLAAYIKKEIRTYEIANIPE